MNERMSPLSQAVLAYVAQHPNCSFEQLCVVFYPGSSSGHGSAVEKFRARVAYLVSVGHLERITVQGGRCYKPGTGQPQPQPKAKPVARASCRRDDSLPWAMPDRYDRMHGPLYSPEQSLPARPGALAYKRVPSLGNCC